MESSELFPGFSDELPSSPRYIKKVAVSDLFGRYSYQIPKGDNVGDISNLLLLYGDNGCGKTTILRTIFNLLSPKLAGGMRSEIGQTPFSRFSVVFDNDIEIHVWRKGEAALVGDYYIGVYYDNEPLFQGQFKVDDDGLVKRKDNPSSESYAACLRSLGLQVFFLPDDRKIRGMPDDEDSEETYAYEERVVEGPDGPRRIRRRVPAERRSERGTSLNASIAASRLTRWIRDTALNASNVGDLSANDIYLKLLKRISAGTREAENEYDKAREQLKAKVRELNEDSKTYIRYGFMSGFPAQDILDVLDAAPSNVLPTLSLVMQPYIESMEARLSALAGLEKTVRVFLETLSSFYVDKNVYFDMRAGVSVKTNSGEEIDLQALSSGERQLMTMLSNAIIASDNVSIFIIDEPEISLNVKWQRTFLDALLTLTEYRNVQFLMATHSIELLSQHTDKVARLEIG